MVFILIAYAYLANQDLRSHQAKIAAKEKKIITYCSKSIVSLVLKQELFSFIYFRPSLSVMLCVVLIYLTAFVYSKGSLFRI